MIDITRHPPPCQLNYYRILFALLFYMYEIKPYSDAEIFLAFSIAPK